eukprot:9807565-Karenia_brevis.AAC.1
MAGICLQRFKAFGRICCWVCFCKTMYARQMDGLHCGASSLKKVDAAFRAKDLVAYALPKQ